MELLSLGEGDIEAVEEGDITPVVDLLETLVGITTFEGVFGVLALDDPNEVIELVLDDIADHPPPPPTPAEAP